jgi:hypothetical protein
LGAKYEKGINLGQKAVKMKENKIKVKMTNGGGGK